MFKVQSSRFGSDKKILLKAERNLTVISHTLTSNLWTIRVHEFFAREISLLQSENTSLRFSTSSMQPLQADVEHPQKETRSQALAKFARFVGRHFGARTILEESGAAPWPYAASDGTPLASGAAAVCVPTSRFAIAKRTLGFGLGRTLLPLSRKRLGLVYDGGQAVPSKSSRLPRSCSAGGQREHAGLVSGIHDDPRLHTQTHPGLGLRRGFRNYQARHQPGLDRTALPFSSHQPIAELPRPTQSQLGRQTLARSALPKCPPSSGAPRWPQVANRAQKTETPCSPGNRIARHAHDRSGVSQADRPFQSLSQISRTGSAEYYRQRRSYEPKSS
jgi:hypothetical protein